MSFEIETAHKEFSKSVKLKLTVKINGDCKTVQGRFIWFRGGASLEPVAAIPKG